MNLGENEQKTVSRFFCTPKSKKAATEKVNKQFGLHNQNNFK
jgi:hypothetical protein